MVHHNICKKLADEEDFDGSIGGRTKLRFVVICQYGVGDSTAYCYESKWLHFGALLKRKKKRNDGNKASQQEEIKSNKEQAPAGLLGLIAVQTLEDIRKPS